MWNPVGVDFYEILTFGNESGDTVQNSLSKEVRIVFNQEMVI